MIEQPIATRQVSIDAYRGFVMLLMASEGLGFTRVARDLPNSGVWQFLAYQTDHVAWRGCSLWDLIQPSFMFMVGVALPYSIASRRAKGQLFGQMFLHALWRSLLLIALGVFLRSVGRPETYFTFEDVLSQIGLGYPFLFLLGWARPRTQFLTALAILLGYWLAFAFYPVPPPDFDYRSVGVALDWPHLHGFAAHWDKNTNLAAAFDQWFLNLFPREKPFVYNGGGYLTLSFIPSLATMVFGLLAGALLKCERPAPEKFWRLTTAGAASLIVGTILDLTGICPSVKRIWSPAWVLISAGWTCWLLASFYALIDWKKQDRWAFPLVVVGMNSIAMYCMAHLFDGFFTETLRVHFGRNFYDLFGGVYAPVVQHALVLIILWLICWWMYRRKIFLRI